MPNYDLGTAHGQIVIDYDDKGAAQASKSFTSLGRDSDSLGNHISGLGNTLEDVGQNFGSVAQNFGRNFTLLAGGVSILTGLGAAMRGLGGNVIGLRSGVAVLGALRTVIGGVPKSIQGFPNVLKQIVLLSAGITLLGGGLGILEELSKRFTVLNRATPVLANLRTKLDDVTKPVKNIAKLVLTIGTFISAVKTVLALSKAVAKLSLVIAGLTAGIHIIALLVGAVEQLSGVAGLLPGALFAAAASAGVFALALHGLQNAFKDMGDPKKFAEDLKDLPPAAQQFARAIQGLRGQFKSLQMDVQERFFNGFGDIVKDIAREYLPILHKNLGNIAGDFNNFGKDLGEWLGWPEVIKDVDSSLGNVHKTLGNLEGAWIALLHIADDFITVSTSFLPRLATGFSDAATAAANFIDNARQTGQLAQWIQNGINAVKLLGSILGNIIGIIGRVFGAFNAAGGGLLNTLNDLTTTLNEFLSSAKGSQALTSLATIFGTISQIVAQVLLAALNALAPVIVGLLPVLQDMATAFGGTLLTAIRIIGPILMAIVTALQILSPYISPFAGSLFALGVVVIGLTSAFKAFYGIISIITVGIKLLRGIVIAFRSVLLTFQVVMFLLEAEAIPLIAVIGLFALAFIAAAAVIAVVVLLIIKYWTQIRAFLVAAWTFISTLAVKVWTDIVNFFRGIWAPVVSWFTNLWNTITSAVSNALSDIGGFFSNIGGAIMDALTTASNAVNGFVSGVLDWFGQLPGRIGKALAALPGILGNALKWAFTRGLYYVVQGIEWIIAALIAFPVDAVIWIFKFGEMLGAAMVTGMNNLVNWVKNGIINIIEFFVTLPDKIIVAVATLGLRFVQWISGVWTGLQQKNAEMWATIIAWFIALPGRVINAVISLKDRISVWIQATWHELQVWNLKEGAAIVTWFKALPGKIVSAVGTLLSKIGNWISSVWSNFMAWNVREGAAVQNWFKGLPGRILSMLAGAGKWLLGIGKAILTGLLDGLKAAWHGVESFVGGIGDKIKALKGPLPYDKVMLNPEGTAIIAGLHAAMEARLPAMLAFVKKIGPQITDAMGTTGGQVALGVTANMAAGTAASAFGAANGSVARGGGAAAPTASTATAAPPRNIVINNLNVAGNLDPSNPVAWRQTIKNLSTELRDLDRSMK